MANLINYIGFIVYGAVAGIAVLSFFLTIGMAFFSKGCARLFENISIPIIIGAIIFVASCWYGIKFGFALDIIIKMLFFSSLFLILIRFKVIKGCLAFHMEKMRSYLIFVGVFFVFYSIVCVFSTWNIASTDLELITLGNNDIFNYVNHASFLFQPKNHNVSGFSYFPTYIQTPGAMHYLGLVSVFFGNDVIGAALPAVFIADALIGLVIVNICRKILLLPIKFAIIIGLIVISGPLFRYITGHYFLSQILGTLLLLLLIDGITKYLLAANYASRNHEIFVYFLCLFLIFFIYPSLFFLALFVSIQFILLFQIISYAFRRRCAEMSYVSIIKRTAGPIALLAFVLPIVFLFDWAYSVQTIVRIAELSQKTGVGWSLGFISPFAILGFPGEIEFTFGIGKSTALASLSIVFLVILYFSMHAGTNEKRFVGTSLLLVFMSSFIIYWIIFHQTGPSYQQWKFASFLPLIFSFVAFVSGFNFIVDALSRYHKRKLILSSSLQNVVVFFMAIFFIGGNGWYSYSHEGRPVSFSKRYQNLEALDKIGNWRNLYVSMANFSTTFLPVYFIRDKTLHLLSSSYYPKEILIANNISHDFPLFIENAECYRPEDVYIKDVGCLFFSVPGFVFNRSYSFSDEDAGIVTTEGLSGRESWGRWNADPHVTLGILGDVSIRNRDRGYVNIQLMPFLGPDGREQPVHVKWGKHEVTTEIGTRGWFSLPYNAEDWNGETNILSIKFHLTGGIVPSEVDSNSSDRRKLAIGFISMGITEKPVGKILGP